LSSPQFQPLALRGQVCLHLGKPRPLSSLFLILLTLFLTACLPDQPLPTLVPAASAPTTLPTALTVVDIPSTFTPPPPDTPTAPPTVTPTPLVPDTPAPSPTLRLVPTSTPVPPPPTPIPAHFPYPANAPFWEYLPITLDCTGRGYLFRSDFPWGGVNRYFHAYVPDCYGQDGRVYPVLYLIHGSIQTDSHFADLGLAHHLDAAIAAGRFPPFIVIMPFSDELGNQTSGGDHSIEGITVNYLIPFIDYNFCTWTEKAGRSIGGISRGGYWALEIAFRHTDLFGAVAGHSTQLRLATDAARYNPLATYAEADLSQMRIWLDWGETDFLRGGQEELDALLTAASIPHETHVNPGGHNEVYWAAHLNEYLTWHAAAWPLDRNQYPLCEK
jgi:enterochelin esterase-like enzyme